MNDFNKMADELIKKIEKQTIDYTCEVKLRNRTPRDWDVRITRAGTKFFYRDNTDFIDGPRYVNLDSNEDESFYSNDPDKCVFQSLTALRVHVPGEGEQTFTARRGVDEGKCMKYAEVTLAPKKIASVDENASASLFDLIEIDIIEDS